MAEIERIYVRGTNWIGDAIMQIPALQNLRRLFPVAEIVLHTRSWAKGIFENADFVNRIIGFEPGGSKMKDVTAQAKTLRPENFDLGVLLPTSFESALVAKLARIRRRFGYAKEARGVLLTDAVEIPAWKNERHEAFYYLNLIQKIERGIFGTTTISDAELPPIRLPVSAARKTEARKILTAHGVDESKRIVALGVGSTNSRAKRWQAESYAKLNDLLQSESNAAVVLIGAQNEIDVSERVFDLAKKKPIILTGKTDLAQAAAILGEADLLVSNDMGLAHVAPATGTKTLVIFGPTNERTTKPIGSETIRKQVECAPCMLRDCPIDHRCMTGISPTEVFARAEQMLKND